jgi:transcriptional regulator with XRE-family HTH domain
MTDADEDIFKQRLVIAREMRGISQLELARRAGIPQSSVSQFETGMRKPSFDNLRRMATTLEVSTDYLLGRVDEPHLAAEADSLYRDAQNLTDANRKLAHDFIQMLASRNKRSGS